MLALRRSWLLRRLWSRLLDWEPRGVGHLPSLFGLVSRVAVKALVGVVSGLSAQWVLACRALPISFVLQLDVVVPFCEDCGVVDALRVVHLAKPFLVPRLFHYVAVQVVGVGELIE